MLTKIVEGGYNNDVNDNKINMLEIDVNGCFFL